MKHPRANLSPALLGLIVPWLFAIGACAQGSDESDVGTGGSGQAGSPSENGATPDPSGSHAPQDGWPQSPGTDGASGDAAATDAGALDAAPPESDSDGPPDSAAVEASPAPAPDDPSDGPAAALLIDGSVHTGEDWSGNPYVGVWGEPFDFHMSSYPTTWAIASVHASMLLRSQGIDYSPNAVLAVAIKESKLQCAEPDFPGGDGCFQIENGTAYLELQRLFGTRFVSPHAEVVGGAHFESAALASVYYVQFSMAMFRLHHDDPPSFFQNHPDPTSRQKVLCAAYNRGLWWNGLTTVFTQCATTDVTTCFEGNAIAIDHAKAIADYTAGLDAAPPFDAPLSFSDLQAYWASIRAMYPDVADADALTVLQAAFDQARGASPTLSFHLGIRTVLSSLITALPPVATMQQAVQGACSQGYLWGDDCL